MKWSYYNENDPFAAAWLRKLITAGHIASGEVDERSVEDVVPTDLMGFTQCHFFAGIGVWSYALRCAGWPDERPVWTGSCPCQPFSSAGKGAGFADERHLWPAFFHLISQCRPITIFGEQVASKDGLAWLDLVQADLEGADYTCGAVDTCAAGFGAPHIRQRLYWVGKNALGNRRGRWNDGNTPRNDRQIQTSGLCTTGGMAYAESGGRWEEQPNTGGCISGIYAGKNGFISNGANERLADTSCSGFKGPGRSGEVKKQRTAKRSLPCGMANTLCQQEYEEQQRPSQNEGSRGTSQSSGCGLVNPSLVTSPIDGHWRDADWLFCRDGKWRATQSVTEQMADGLAHRLGYSRFGNRYSLNPLQEKAENRVGRLRGYGNAIVAPQAQSFIEAYMQLYKNQKSPL